MSQVVIATHGTLSTALKETAEIIAGELDSFSCFELTPDLEIDTAKKRLTDLIEQGEQGEGRLLVLVDLQGGTPFLLSSQLLLAGHDFDLLTGVNLPMVIEAISSAGDENQAEAVLEAGRQGAMNVNALLKETENSND